ncbi:MAG: MerR family transcriptional regulator [Polaromonas sp.]
MENSFPPIPAKRYFTISEVSKLCGVKPHVLRYWEQEFTQLSPMKRRGNRRYYQLHEVKLIRQIRQLLYEQKFTISGAQNKLQEALPSASGEASDSDPMLMQMKSQAQQNGNSFSLVQGSSANRATPQNRAIDDEIVSDPAAVQPLLAILRHELMNIRDLLGSIDR